VITKCSKRAQTGSLLENVPGYVTILLVPKHSTIRSAAYVQKSLLSEISLEDTETFNIKSIKLTQDGGAVADIPENFVEKVLESNKRRTNMTISTITELPPLVEKEGNGEEGKRPSGYWRGGKFHSFGKNGRNKS